MTDAVWCAYHQGEVFLRSATLVEVRKVGEGPLAPVYACPPCMGAYRLTRLVIPAPGRVFISGPDTPAAVIETRTKAPSGGPKPD